MERRKVKISVWAYGLGLLTVAGLVLGIGCNSWHSRAYSGDAYGLPMRPASTDTARLLRNAHYFKLMGRPEVAVKELEEAYQQDPANLKLANTLAGCYEDLGRSERAQQIYLEALARNQDNQPLANNLCFSYYQAGKFRQAESCFRQALERQPTNTAARNNLGLLLCRTGRQDEARRLWQEAEGTGPAEGKLSEALAALGMGGALPVRSAAAAAAPTPTPERQATAPAAAITPSRPRSAARPTGGTISSTPPLSAPAQAPAPAPVASLAPGPAADLRSGAVESPQAATPAAPRKAEVARVETAPPPGSGPETGGSAPAAQKLPTPAAPPVVAQARLPEAAPLPARPAGVAPPAKAPEASPAPATKPPAVAPPPGTGRGSVGYLTCEELVGTGIEVRNGNGIRDLARKTRSWLDLEGFNVVDIANHRDFGMEKTIIYYRPGAEKVARTLSHKYFQGADIESRPNLAAKVDVRIVLGHDLPGQQAQALNLRAEKAL